MRLFLVSWSGFLPDLIDVAKNLETNGHEILYCLTSFQYFDLEKRARFPKTIFHDHVDALFARPAPGVDTSSFVLPDPRLIASLAGCESDVLVMMNKKYEWMEILERKHLYYRLVAYWEGVLETMKPEALVFTVTPHTVYDYVLYCLAQRRGIRIILFEATWINDRLLIMNDYKTSCAALRDAALEAKSGTLEDLSPDLQSYYKEQTDSRTDTTPLAVKNIAAAYAPLKALRLKARAIAAGVKRGTLTKNITSFVAKKFHSDQRKEYISLQVPVDLEKKFLYLPLHYQPECTTAPMGGVFVEQLLMIEMLSKALPSDWIIYVKEHPIQWLPRGASYFNYRYEGYYRAIAALPNVCLIPITTDTYTLINRSQAVATITGTAGWEALLRGKPTLVFGYSWYRYAPGAYRVDSVPSLSDAFAKITAGVRHAEADMLGYLRCFDRISFHGYLEEYGRDTSSVKRDQNVATVTEKLLAALIA